MHKLAGENQQVPLEQGRQEQLKNEVSNALDLPGQQLSGSQSL